MGVLLDSELARSEHIFTIVQNLKVICDCSENAFRRRHGTWVPSVCQEIKQNVLHWTDSKRSACLQHDFFLLTHPASAQAAVAAELVLAEQVVLEVL